ncbi:MAG TPA: hypothetical protein VKD69_04265 [Vicinamibacterales bacterium]|nr:hypothetical protein [Vicinamibacterales bacterium]
MASDCVGQRLDRDVATGTKRWPFIMVTAMFIVGVGPAFLPQRPAPAPRAATSGASAAGPAATTTNSSKQPSTATAAAPTNASRRGR